MCCAAGALVGPVVYAGRLRAEDDLPWRHHQQGASPCAHSSVPGSRLRSKVQGTQRTLNRARCAGDIREPLPSSLEPSSKTALLALHMAFQLPSAAYATMLVCPR